MNLMRHRWFVVRLVIGLLLLYLLARTVNWSHIVEIIRNLRMEYAVAVVILAFADRIFMALKWRVLLAASRITVPARETIRAYLVGSFVGMFFPTSVGGDLVRLYILGIGKEQRETVAATIVVERIFAFLALIVLCLLATSALAVVAVQSTQALLLAVLFSAALATGLVWFSFHPLPLRMAEILPGRIGSSIRRILAAYQQFQDNRRALGIYFLLSLAEHCIPVLCNYLAAVSLGIHLNVVAFFVVIPVILVVSRLPISIDGLGIQEGLYWSLFQIAGLSPEQALTLALLTRALTLVAMLPGAGFFIFRPKGSGLKNTPSM